MSTSHASPPSDPIVVIDRISKNFGDVVAVREATLSIRRGEFFAIVGPSGSGKTTLLRAIAGFVFPDSGRILIDNRDVSKVPPYRRPCNMVFQNYALFPHLNVERNIAFGLVESHVSKAEIARRVNAILALVHLSHVGGRSPDQLSGGQQQRVALARALVNDPVVLLLDEPLGSLDAKLRKAMQLELKRIQREVGMTFIHITHDQEEALVMSDRIAVMNGGVIQQVGTPQEIYDEPTNEFVAEFIGESNLLPGTISEFPSADAVRVRLSSGASIVAPTTAKLWRAGDAVKLLLRPEWIRVAGTERHEPGNALVGRLNNRVYQGSSIRFEVITDDGGVIVALAPSSQAVVADEGGRVSICWSARDGYLLPVVAEQTSPLTGPSDADRT